MKKTSIYKGNFLYPYFQVFVLFQCFFTRCFSHGVSNQNSLTPKLANEYFQFNFAKYSIPHPLKKEKGGEDAAECGNQHLIVADGVGGWAQHGIDSGAFSKMLVKNINQHLNNLTDWTMNDLRYNNDTIKQINLREILNDSFEDVDVLGSTTITFAFLNPKSNKLYISHLGDSGLMILRPENRKKVENEDNDRINLSSVFETLAQQHDFNTPFQLGKLSRDTPELSLNIEIDNPDVGDRIILATDGLWDNVFKSDILELSCIHNNPKSLAKALAEKAYSNSQNKNYISPFALSYKDYLQKKGISRYMSKNELRGGKPDDISVVVGFITNNSIANETLHFDDSAKTRNNTFLFKILSAMRIINDHKAVNKTSLNPIFDHFL